MEVPRHWRLNNQRYRLVGSFCPKCERVDFPPRQICPDCRGTVKIDNGSGMIYKSIKVLETPSRIISNFSISRQ